MQKLDDMQAIIDVIPNPIFVKNRRHKIVLLNASACELFGHSREKVLSSNDFELFPAEQVRVFQAADEVVFNSGQEYENEEKITDGSGAVRSVITRKRRVMLGDEQYLVAATADVTTYREADRERYFDLSLDLLCIATPEGYFKSVNPAFRAALGWHDGELLERPFLDFVHPEDREPTLCEMRAQASGKTTENFENRYRCADGSYRWLAWKAVTAIDGLMYAAARDVTDARAANALLAQAKVEAEAASRAKSAFLATMSHEIRTPMNGVMGMIEVLERTPLTRDQLDMTRTVRESASALLSLIDDILDFSKIEAGRLELEREPVELIDVVEGLCSSLIPVATRKNVRLATFVSPLVPHAVLSDDTRLRQLLYNLVGNAIKFSGGRPEAHGRVSIEVELAQAVPLRVAFKVIDNGIGMTDETLSKLFMAFTQAEISTTRRFGGTGLGLAICRRLTELMNGRISVASEVGVGSTFTVELPFELATGRPAPRYESLSGVDCVVLDTATFDASYVRAYLEHAGANARVAAGTAFDAGSARAGAPLVLVHDGRHDFDLAQLRGQRPHEGDAIRHLVIVPGHRGTARVEAPDRVVLGADGLRRETLLQGVAIAAGRASPRHLQQETAKTTDAVRAAPLGIAEARAQGRLVLVAEDDNINQKVILRQLGLLGYAAEIAGDGKEALRLWRENEYVLLLSDLHMPNMDGYELAGAIRKEEARAGARRMPIVALTANALVGEAARAKAAGMDAYLTKPLQLDALKTALDTWLSPREAPAPERVAPTPSPEAPAAPAVDFTVLASLVGDDNAIIRELLTDYLASLRRLAPELRQHAGKGNARDVASIAHKLKSSSRSVGALALGDLCNELENAGRAEDRDRIAQWRARFDAALPRIESEIEAFLNTE